MSNANKTLVILTPGFPKDETDTACLPFPQLFVKTLKKENPSLNIIVLAFQYPFSNTAYEWHGVNIVPFNGKDKGKLNRLLVWWKVLRRLNVIMKQNQVIGILNLWLGECALVGKYAAKKFGARSLNWLMGQDAKKNNRYFSFIKPKAENLIALSDFLAAEFYKNYKIKPLYVIPPGIDPADFPGSTHTRTIDIIGAGSLITLKQYDIFIQVVAKIAKKHPRVKAVICGKGPERNSLFALIEAAGLHANIVLLDETDHREVLDLMQHSKILLHTSAYEGFATVYSEALYAGAHVVGFCRPMNDLFKHQHVAGSESEMAAQVDKILSDDQVDHSPVLTFPIEETCKKILSLYN
jgi:glycosyltransferase involved in cell wall biosynthesis